METAQQTQLRSRMTHQPNRQSYPEHLLEWICFPNGRHQSTRHNQALAGQPQVAASHHASIMTGYQQSFCRLAPKIAHLNSIAHFLVDVLFQSMSCFSRCLVSVDALANEDGCVLNPSCRPRQRISLHILMLFFGYLPIALLSVRASDMFLNVLEISNQSRKLRYDGVPNDIDIDVKVTVGDPVSHAPHALPGNMAVAF